MAIITVCFKNRVFLLNTPVVNCLLVPPELQQERRLSEEEQEYAPVPTPRKSRSPSNVIPLTITTGTISSPSEEPCGKVYL